MSYLVLARKWRPQSWDQVVSQEHVSATLRNAVQHNRLAHAYLFAGPRGVGKTSAARILAKALNCEQGPTHTPCNECSNCIEIAESRSVDVFEIDGASNRGIDEVRNLRENIRYTPAKGKFRIYIIDEVHMLTTEAFNALLKTLEEPPSHVLFIFATTEPHKVPATIVSRCQRFDFHRISVQDIIKRLKRICQEDGIEIEEEALILIARKADGSLRDSQSILDQIISYTGEKIKAEHVIKGLGLIEQEIFFEVTDILASGEVSKGLELVDRVISGGYDIEEFLVGLTEHLRNILVIKGTGSADLVEASGVHKKRYQETGKNFQEEDLLRLMRIVTDTMVVLKRSMNPRIPLEMALVKMIKLDRTVVIGDLLSRLESLGMEKDVKHETSEPLAKTKVDFSSDENNPKQEVSDVEKKTSLTMEKVQGRWEDIIRRIKHKKITVGSFLQEGILLGVKGNTVEIGFGMSNGFHIDAITRSEKIVLEVLKEVFGGEVKFRCIKRDLPQQKRVLPSKKEKLETLKMLEEKEPIIKKIVDDFDVEIVE